MTSTAKKSQVSRSDTPAMVTRNREKGSVKQANIELIDNLQSAVDLLVSQLARQRFENSHLEGRIRDEIYHEYVKLHSELHRRYSDERREAVEDVEDLAEERMRIYKDAAGEDTSSFQSDRCSSATTLESASQKNDNGGKTPKKANSAKQNFHVESILKLKTVSVQTNVYSSDDGNEVEQLKQALKVKEKELSDVKVLLKLSTEKCRQIERERDELVKITEDLRSGKAVDTNGRECRPPMVASNGCKMSSTDSGVRVSSRQQRQARFAVHHRGDNSDWESAEGELDRSFTGPAGGCITPGADFPPTSAYRLAAATSVKKRSSQKRKRTSLSVNSFRDIVKRRSIAAKKRKGFKDMVRMNRAYLLKAQSSPVLLHDHKTGMTYKKKVAPRTAPRPVAIACAAQGPVLTAKSAQRPIKKLQF